MLTFLSCKEIKNGKQRHMRRVLRLAITYIIKILKLKVLYGLQKLRIPQALRFYRKMCYVIVPMSYQICSVWNSSAKVHYFCVSAALNAEFVLPFVPCSSYVLLDVSV